MEEQGVEWLELRVQLEGAVLELGAVWGRPQEFEDRLRELRDKIAVRHRFRKKVED